MDLAFSESSQDLELNAFGDLFFVEGTEGVRQHLARRLRFLIGEWFLDAREGVPYFEQIIGKGRDITTIRTIIRRVITDTPGIISISELYIDLDSKERILKARFTARTEDGLRLLGDFDVPFIVSAGVGER